MSLPAGFGGGGGAYSSKGDKGLSMPLLETLRLSWADPELRTRIIFVLAMFSVFTLGVHIPVPVPGLSSADVMKSLENLPALQLLNSMSGGALRRLSVFALGLNPYITASIILQIYAQANPAMAPGMAMTMPSTIRWPMFGFIKLTAAMAPGCGGMRQ